MSHNPNAFEQFIEHEALLIAREILESQGITDREPTALEVKAVRSYMVDAINRAKVAS